MFYDLLLYLTFYWPSRRAERAARVLILTFHQPHTHRDTQHTHTHTTRERTTHANTLAYNTHTHTHREDRKSEYTVTCLTVCVCTRVCRSGCDSRVCYTAARELSEGTFEKRMKERKSAVSEVFRVRGRGLYGYFHVINKPYYYYYCS